MKRKRKKPKTMSMEEFFQETFSEEFLQEAEVEYMLAEIAGRSIGAKEDEMSGKMLEELERLNVTLGAICDSISAIDRTDTELDDVLDHLHESATSLTLHLKASGGDRQGIDRLVRMNRELVLQLQAVRAIANYDPCDSGDVTEGE